MRENILKTFITPEEMRQIYQDAAILKEDFDFFNLYIKRNRKTDLYFELIPFKGMAKNFFTKLYSDYYAFCYDEFDVLLTEYRVAKHFMKTLDGSGGFYSEKDIKQIYNYFKEKHQLDLIDYVSNFVDSSSGCEHVIKQIKKIK